MRFFRIKTILTACAVFFMTATPIASAQLLPQTNLNEKDCLALLYRTDEIEKKVTGETALTVIDDGLITNRSQVLGCAIKTGKIEFWMIPFFIVYIINFILGLAGLIAVLFIVIGGYRYAVGGVTGDKEGGKNTVTYAVIGLIVTLMAWIIVNVVQTAVTS